LELVLQASEAKLNDILQSAHSSSIVSFRFFPDRTWEYEYQSSGCETLFGYTAEEICADKALWMSQVFAADRENILYPLFEDILRERSRAIEFRFHHKNRSLRWISATYTSRYEPASGCWIVTGVSTDITERKLTEQSLQESEERLRIALEAARMGSWDWNIVTNQIIWSESLEQLMGLEPGTFDGRFETVNAMIYPDDRPRVFAAITHSIEQNADYDIEFRFVKPDGTIRWALSKGRVFYDQNGQPIRMTGNDTDITEHKLAEAALQQSEARFQEIAHTISQLFFVRSASTGEFIYVSPAYEQIWGRSCESLYQDPQSWTETIHPDDRDHVAAAFQAKLQGNSIRLEYRILQSGGAVRWISAEVSVIQDGAGNPLRFVGLAEDITDRKQAELVLQQAKEAAEAANLAKSTFLANMSHELRTPLNVILGYTQLLSYDVTLIPEYQEYLRSIHRSGNHLLALINDVLDLSKIEAGRLALDESQFSLGDLLQTLWEMFRLRAELKGVNLNLDLSPDVPQFIVADLNKLRQVIINLLNNAVKFTETGAITLRITIGEPQRESEPEKIHLQMEVMDTGVGMAPDEL
ncbi:MAG TPA: PAS domain-containing protein, partial [Allocoleopsis sp.]